MSDFGSWMPDPRAAVSYSGERDEAKAQRYKFFAAVAVWLTLAIDASTSGLVYFEGGMSAMGALCCAGLIFSASLLVLVGILALIWSGAF